MPLQQLAHFGTYAWDDVNPTLRTATVFWRQRHSLPQTLILFVTSRCNARCDFCLYWDQINDPVPRSQELTPGEVNEIARQYGPLNNLSLSGGEPFVRSDLPELCQPFIDHCGTSVIDIPSNFWFTEKMVDQLERLAGRNPEVLVEVQLSLDHVGPAHDLSRRVDGLYARVKATLDALAPVRERCPNLRIKASLVWLERNRDDMERITAEVGQTLDVDRIHVAYPNQIISPDGDPAVAADITRFDAACHRVAAHSPGAATDIYSASIRGSRFVQSRLLSQAASGQRPLGDFCQAGRWVLVINERGEVFPCEPLWESIGNVRDHNLDVGAVLEGPAYADFRKRRLGNGSCNCTWGVAISASIASRVRFAPELAGRAVQITLRRNDRHAVDTG